jgi:Methyltransferase domain
MSFTSNGWLQFARVRGRILGMSEEEIAWETGPRLAGLYRIVRQVRPQLVIETGVCRGFTSAGILAALRDNGGGTLVSIDLPTTDPVGRINADGVRDTAHVPSVGCTGFVVAGELRSRWELHIGSSRELLPGILATRPPVDLFWHDSEHSFANMTWEYTTVWSHLRPGGVMASDDVCWNPAFATFCYTHHVSPRYWPVRYFFARELLGSSLVYRGWVRRP